MFGGRFVILDGPVSFAEAIKALAVKSAMPTSLDTAGLRTIDAGIRRQSLFSAKTMMEDYLGDIRGVVHSILEPMQGISKDRASQENPEGKVTVGIDPATARLKLKEALKKYGYSPEPGEAGTLKDLASDSRLNLVVKTNVELAQGAGNFVKSQDADVLDLFPAQELVRYEQRNKERDWKERWREAAQESGDAEAGRVLNEQGRMVALKDSPIWDALGSSDLFDDALDNPYPPFAFNSGMWVRDVDRKTAEKFGLLAGDETPEPQALDLGSLFGIPD